MPAASRSFRFCCLSALLCIFSLFPALHAQSSEADIKAQLMGKPLYLRGFWRDDTLHFDAAGHLTNSSTPFPFTLSGFQLKKVHLKQNKLILEGRRVGLKLADNKQIRVSLDPPIQIDIAASPTGDYGQALDAIFANGLADLVPSLPFYWKTYASKTLWTSATQMLRPRRKRPMWLPHHPKNPVHRTPRPFVSAAELPILGYCILPNQATARQRSPPDTVEPSLSIFGLRPRELLLTSLSYVRWGWDLMKMPCTPSNNTCSLPQPRTAIRSLSNLMSK